jgi:ParB-like chromosome segregation protein Spo0J
MDHVRLLAETETPLPPIVVHHSTMQVIDGRHRVRAAELRGESHVEVRFFEGSQEDAFVLSVRLNTTHGLPLSQADRAAAATRIVGTHPQWSNRMIASVAGLSAKTVGAIRERSTGEIPQLNARVGQDGRARPIDPRQGREAACRLLSAQPDASLRQIAEASGIALATAKDVRERIRRGEDPIPAQLRRTQKLNSPAASGTRGTATGAQVAPSPAENQSQVFLQRLRKDPSLRFSDAGRNLLRLLGERPMEAKDWERLAESVPQHWIEAVARIAREYAQDLTHFAHAIEKRQHATW